MLKTAKQLRKELNISIDNWNYWKTRRKADYHKFPEPDNTIYASKNNPKVPAWDFETFKKWWESRPPACRPFKDITNL